MRITSVESSRIEAKDTVAHYVTLAPIRVELPSTVKPTPSALNEAIIEEINKDVQ